mgnify:FL=1
MKGKLLFDASSLVYALKLKHVNILYGNYIHYLIIYEVLNAIWKETYLLKSLSLKEAEKLIDIVAEALDYLNVLLIHPYQSEIFKKATKSGLTIYDASYIVLAEKNNLTLITEDKKLREKASETVKTISLKDLIK